MKDNKINTKQLFVILICNTIGAGIFFVPSGLMIETNSKKLSLACWGISYIIAVMFGLCYAELGSTYPFEGGDAKYLGLAYGSILSNIFSFMSVCVVLPCSCSIMIKSIFNSFNWSLRIQKAGIFILLNLMALLNWSGNQSVYKVQYILTILKLVVVSFFVIFAGLVFVQAIKLVEKIDDIPPIAENKTLNSVSIWKNILKLANGMLLTLWSYDGWNSGNFVAHTVKNPGRSFPIAITASSTAVAIIYILINLSFFKVLSIEKIMQGDLISNFFYNLDIPDWVKKIMPLIVNTIPSLGTMNGTFLVASSIIDSFITKYNIDISNNDDKESIELSCGPSKEKLIAFLLFAILVFIYTFYNLIETIKKINFVIYFFYGLSIYAIIRLRKKDKDIPRPFKTSKILIYLCLTISLAIGATLILKKI